MDSKIRYKKIQGNNQMKSKMVKYQCLKCYHIFESVPGPTQCIHCGNYYCERILDNMNKK